MITEKTNISARVEITLKKIVEDSSFTHKDAYELGAKLIAMGEADTLVSPTGEVMALWKNTKPTMKFNAKAFQQDDPAGYAKYMEPTASTRRFSVK